MYRNRDEHHEQKLERADGTQKDGDDRYDEKGEHEDDDVHDGAHGTSRCSASISVPRFGDMPMDKLDHCRCRGDERHPAQTPACGPKTVRTIINFVGAVCEHAVDRGRAVPPRPARPRPLPRRPTSSARRARPDPSAYRLRRSELDGLRWRDVDWAAQRIRVGHTYVRGEYSSAGESDLSTRRSVPMA